MAQKLWEKSVQVDRDVERFTVGKDREMDLYLAPFDILGSDVYKRQLLACAQALYLHGKPRISCLTLAAVL